MLGRIIKVSISSILLSLLLVTTAQADDLMDLIAKHQQNNLQQVAYIPQETYPDNFKQNLEEADDIEVLFQDDPLLLMLQSLDSAVSDEDIEVFKFTYQNNSKISTPRLSSLAAIVVDAENNNVLYQKNSDRTLPIASISKLMSAMVVLDSNPDMNQILTISNDDIDRLKGSSSRLSVGTKMTRQDMLHVGLMSSENRAIHAMARAYPGGMNAFLAAMNKKAADLGMTNTVFYDPTGLDPRNQSTAQDLVRMVKAAYEYPLIREYSTSNDGAVKTSKGKIEKYHNSNRLIRTGDWDIKLQKTGYIREAGRCMVVYANIKNKPLIIVLMNAPSTTMRVNDANSMRSWVMSNEKLLQEM